MSTRAKFKVDKIVKSIGSVPVFNPVTEKTDWVHGEVNSVHMSPVYGNGDPAHENTKFWHASPSGEFRIECGNKEALAGFELGREYYFDITPAD